MGHISLFMILALVASHTMARIIHAYNFNYDETSIRKFLDGVVSRMNKFSSRVNINVTEVGFEVWTNNEYINYHVIESGDHAGKHEVLEQLRTYRQTVINKQIGTDFILLISGRRIAGVNGAAVAASICNTERAVGFVTFQKNDPYKVAYTTQTSLHEMGHALGMKHDAEDCECSEGLGQCIMAATQSVQQTVNPTFSQCSLITLSTDISDGHLDCLNSDEPNVETTCGNGVVNTGEDCDCGHGKDCDCCDGVTCKFLEEGQSCRNNECKTCSGSSSKCEGSLLDDFTTCDSGRGLCHDQSCSSNNLACQKIFGPSAHNDVLALTANDEYSNTEFNGGGERIYDPDKGRWGFGYFVKDNGDGSCGQLQCITENNARVLDKKGNFVRSMTFQIGRRKQTRIAYELIGDRFAGTKKYIQFYPILAPKGAPCKMKDGQKGVCNNDLFKKDKWNWETIRYASCEPLPLN